MFIRVSCLYITLDGFAFASPRGLWAVFFSMLSVKIAVLCRNA